MPRLVIIVHDPSVYYGHRVLDACCGCQLKELAVGEEEEYVRAIAGANVGDVLTLERFALLDGVPYVGADGEAVSYLEQVEVVAVKGKEA
jgi:hypothetical protein